MSAETLNQIIYMASFAADDAALKGQHRTNAAMVYAGVNAATHASGPRAGQPVTPDEPAGRRPMDVAEFRREGYLQEVNRQFFHPLGLALAVTVDPDGRERLSGVWDDRDDPEGIRYAPGVIDPEKTARVLDAQRRMGDSRMAVLGYVVQPVADQPEPATAPAVPSGAAAAAAGPHPDTPDRAPGVLGRAVLTADGEVWRVAERGYAERFHGRGREVLLLSPAAGRVLDAARHWREAFVDAPGWPERARVLAAAVDALDGDQPAEPGRCEQPVIADPLLDDEELCGNPLPCSDHEPTPAPAVVRLAEGVHWLGEVEPEDSHSLTDHARLPTGPAPEPDSGPGWLREDIEGFAANLSRAPDSDTSPWNPEIGDQLRALLADRDYQEERRFALNQIVSEAWDERDAARADRDRLRREWAEADAVAQDYGNRLDAEADAHEAADAEVDSGPGWNRDGIDRIIEMVDKIPQGASGDGAQLRALLADRDRLDGSLRFRLAELGARYEDLHAARAELAEVTADRDRRRTELTAAEREVAAAVDALDGDQPAEPERTLADLYRDLREPRSCPTCSGLSRETVGMVCQTCGTDYGPPAEPAPEPDSGPGWNRTDIENVAVWLESAPDHPEPGPELAASLRALLADRDQGWALLAEVERKWLAQAARATAAEQERDAARAELAEVTADRDRLRQRLADSIDPATIPDQQARGWPDWHPEDYCHRCGHRNVSWFADSAIWNEVHGGSGPIWCPVCFAAAYEQQTGQCTSWRLAPAGHHDQVGHLIRSEAEMRHELAEARAELATARRDAAADALDAALEWLDPSQPGSGSVTLDYLARAAAEIRDGTRPVPGSPQPASEGGGDDAE